MESGITKACFKFPLFSVKTCVRGNRIVYVDMDGRTPTYPIRTPISRYQYELLYQSYLKNEIKLHYKEEHW